MAARTPWDRFATVLAQDSSVDALWLSLRTCLAAVLVDVVVGVPLAVLLARPISKNSVFSDRTFHPILTKLRNI